MWYSNWHDSMRSFFMKIKGELHPVEKKKVFKTCWWDKEYQKKRANLSKRIAERKEPNELKCAW